MHYCLHAGVGMAKCVVALDFALFCVSVQMVQVVALMSLSRKKLDRTYPEGSTKNCSSRPFQPNRQHGCQ